MHGAEALALLQERQLMPVSWLGDLGITIYGRKLACAQSTKIFARLSATCEILCLVGVGEAGEGLGLA